MVNFCCFNCTCNTNEQFKNGNTNACCTLNCLCKPVKVLFATFANWWIPRFCLLWCIILLFIVSFGFKIRINQSVFDLNDNISTRELTWYFLNIFTTFIIAFYCIEWNNLTPARQKIITSLNSVGFRGVDTSDDDRDDIDYELGNIISVFPKEKKSDETDSDSQIEEIKVIGNAKSGS